MKNAFVPFMNYIEPTIDDFSIIKSPLNINNVDDFISCRKDIFELKNNQFSDYDEENEEEEDDFPYVTPKNCISNNEESPNLVNIFSFENEPKEAINHVFIENDNNKEDEISKKMIKMSDFLGENNSDKENSDELNSLSKDDSLKDTYNKSNNINILGEPENNVNILNKTCKNINIKNIIKKQLKKDKNKTEYLEFDYTKKFQLFNKGTNNKYVNEIINLINNKEKNQKKLFKIYSCGNENAVKLVGRKRKNKKKKRCEKPDDIRKKLKSRFHKIFTKKLNDNLKAANSEKEFYPMPQIFISNIAKKHNKNVMNMELKDLFKKDFIEDYKDYKSSHIKSSNDKYIKNINTLNYLEKNIDILEKSNFNIIGGMKYSEILEEFFYSEEFENTVISESKKKSPEYIQDYVLKARTYVQFFTSNDSD